MPEKYSRYNMMGAERKRAAFEAAEVTLDGKPARVIGWMLANATVRPMDGSADVQFSWPAVARIVKEHGGAFKSEAA